MSNHEHDHCGCGCEHHDHDHKPMDKYMTAINQSQVTIDDAAVSAAVRAAVVSLVQTAAEVEKSGACRRGTDGSRGCFRHIG